MRELSTAWKVPLILVALAAGLFHLHASGFGSPEPRTFRGLHLAMLLPPVFILFKARKSSPESRPSAPDLILAAIGLAASLYTVYHANRLNERFVGLHEVRVEEVVLGGLLALVVIEACRRAVSKWFALTVGVVLVYLLTCQYWPGMFHFKAFSLDRAVEVIYMPQDEGVFGFLMGISAQILYIYILFAAVMTATGAGDFLVELSTWAAGWARGGAAKIAIVSSALYGTVSGSTVANVYATGSFTIPLMKRAGYTRKQSAAVEAIAGTGGQIMPPVMGAGSFIMSEVTGVPYFTIIKVAVIPALLYYLGVFAMVHLIAKARGIAPLPRSDRPPTRNVLRRLYLILPFVALVYLLATGYSPTKAAFHSVWFAAILSLLSRRTRLNGPKILDLFFKAMVNCALIASVLAGSGMVVGVLTRTGVALSFGTILSTASFGYFVVALVLVFVIISVLGTAIPTTAAYIIGVTVGAKVLGDYDVPLLAAHFFVFYYAVLADLTPPDAVTAFAAANLAGSEPMATGIEAFRLGIAGFLVPFAFVCQPALLLNGDLLDIAISFGLTALGVVCLAGAIIGHWMTPLGWPHRLLLLGGAACLVFPTRGMELLGLGVAAAVLIWSWMGRQREGGDLQSKGQDAGGGS